MAWSEDRRDSVTPDADDEVAEGDAPFMAPVGSVGRRLYQRMAAGDREAAVRYGDYADRTAGAPVPPDRLWLSERLAAELGVDREALVREALAAAGRD